MILTCNKKFYEDKIEELLEENKELKGKLLKLELKHIQLIKNIYPYLFGYESRFFDRAEHEKFKEYLKWERGMI